eukprot:4613398-Amphidinium_carterae.1
MSSQEDKDVALARWVDQKCTQLLSTNLKLSDTGSLSRVEREIGAAVASLRNSTTQELMHCTQYEGVLTTSQVRTLLSFLIDEDGSKGVLMLSPLFKTVAGDSDLKDDYEYLADRLKEFKDLNKEDLEKLKAEHDENLATLDAAEAHEETHGADEAKLDQIRKD